MNLLLATLLLLTVSLNGCFGQSFSCARDDDDVSSCGVWYLSFKIETRMQENQTFFFSHISMIGFVLPSVRRIVTRISNKIVKYQKPHNNFIFSPTIHSQIYDA